MDWGFRSLKRPSQSGKGEKTSIGQQPGERSYRCLWAQASAPSRDIKSSAEVLIKEESSCLIQPLCTQGIVVNLVEAGAGAVRSRISDPHRPEFIWRYIWREVMRQGTEPNGRILAPESIGAIISPRKMYTTMIFICEGTVWADWYL